MGFNVVYAMLYLENKKRGTFPALRITFLLWQGTTYPQFTFI